MSNELALVKKNIVDVVQGKIKQCVTTGELNIPHDYSPANALKSAFLILQDVQNMSKQPVLTACTPNSIANSLFNMVIQGLNPAKQQCYFIAYGKDLACQRSYFGNMALARRVNPSITDIVGEVVYEKDDFQYEIVRGRKIVTSHRQSLGNINKKNIIAAYGVIYAGDTVVATEILTIDQIHQSWRQSKASPFESNGAVKAGSVHGKFTEEMCKKTAITKVCKTVINSSSDATILLRAVRETDEAIDISIDQNYQENANQEVLDFDQVVDGDEVVDTTTGEVITEEGPVDEATTEKEENPFPEQEEKEGKPEVKKAIKEELEKLEKREPGF